MMLGIPAIFNSLERAGAFEHLALGKLGKSQWHDGVQRAWGLSVPCDRKELEILLSSSSLFIHEDNRSFPHRRTWRMSTWCLASSIKHLPLSLPSFYLPSQLVSFTFSFLPLFLAVFLSPVFPSSLHPALISFSPFFLPTSFLSSLSPFPCPFLRRPFESS